MLSRAQSSRKLYTAPTLRKLTREQATLFLVGHAYIGHQGAREILEILFPAPGVVTKIEGPQHRTEQLGQSLQPADLSQT
jgi:hypothetical protein